MKKTILTIATLAAILLALPALSAPVIVFAAEGSLVELGNLNNSLKITTAKDINNNGAVVGESAVADQVKRAFLWQSGSLTNLGSLGGNSSAAAINDNGLVVGYSNDAIFYEDTPNATVIMQAVMWENNKIKELGFLASGNYSQATDVNNNGQAVGYSNLYSNIKDGGSGNYHAFIWQAGVMKDLGVASCNGSAVYFQEYNSFDGKKPAKTVLSGNKVYLLSGDVLLAYNQVGGVCGQLGLPTSEFDSVGKVQTFQHGSIRINNAGRAVVSIF